MANTLRDIALTVGATSLVVLTTLFGVKQCSCDDKDVVKSETKTPKIEVVNKNNVVVGDNTNVRNDTRVVVGDDIVVENNNIVVNDNRQKCGKDTVVLVIEPKTQQKQQQKQQQKDTVEQVVAEEPSYTISAVHVCVRGNSLCR